ncbi:unnamed protein product [Mycena citricolor]|uniref:Carrier domain-containing protein n=1 Tax=Mycena citricolor TaxID=2018698 RepID=A0AAD2H0N4_9AGAR|nr:unnamed protein product [Mycena citricolor]
MRSSSKREINIYKERTLCEQEPGSLLQVPMAHGSFFLPKLDASQNLGRIYDFILDSKSTRVAYSFAAEESDECTDITQTELVRAACRAAHILRPAKQGADKQIVAILALSDVLIYQAVIIGCIRSGLIPFPISHRNSPAAIVHLIKATGAHRILTTHASYGHVIETLCADIAAQDPTYELSVEEMPSLGALFPRLGRECQEDAFTPYPTLTSPSTDTALILHSSGSTGFPKPIPLSHRALIETVSFGSLKSLTDEASRIAVGHLPPFHTMGNLLQHLLPVLIGATACIFPPASSATEYRIPPAATSDLALRESQRAHATCIMTVPSFVLEWARNAEDVQYLKTLDLVAFAGGPLSLKVGDALIAQGVNAVNIYGSTEGGVASVVGERCSPDWSWFKFPESRVNIRWVPQGDGSYEMQFLTVDTHHPALENLPDVRGYATSDLFERHPTRADLFRIIGRADDVIIMANGEKAVPGPMEDIITANRNVSGAVMFGRERNQVGVIVEPSMSCRVDVKDEVELARFRNLIWDSVQEANEQAPAFARIYKEMIIVTGSERPMIRAAKGTIIKKPTVLMYQPDIDALYDAVEASSSAAADISPPTSWTTESLIPWLRMQATALSDKEIDVGTDLFDQGFDSLNATFLRHRIVAILKTNPAAAKAVEQNLIYAHPTIVSLAAAISSLISAGSVTAADPKAEIEAMIQKYSVGLDRGSVRNAKKAPADGDVVLITGSTGGLGSHLLAVLVGAASVRQIYAFNRHSPRASSSERQREAFRDRGFNEALLASEKIVYLEGSTWEENLGLGRDIYEQLCCSVSVIIHNAWTLDFNKSLVSFEPHIRGTRNLVDLAIGSGNARFLFTSSIASAKSWDPKLGPFPEEVQLDASIAVGNGYGEGKYVSERIIHASGLDATSFRIGQVCGSQSNGAWATTDWVPALVKSSIALRCLPSDPDGTNAWISPEAVAESIVELALRVEPPPFSINLVHPHAVSWDSVMNWIAQMLDLPLVSFENWVAALEKSAIGAGAAEFERIPALKLIDFFKSAETAGQFSTTKAQCLDSMRNLPQISPEEAKKWLSYWRGKGYLPAE